MVESNLGLKLQTYALFTVVFKLFFWGRGVGLNRREGDAGKAQCGDRCRPGGHRQPRGPGASL